MVIDAVHGLYTFITINKYRSVLNEDHLAQIQNFQLDYVSRQRKWTI